MNLGCVVLCTVNKPCYILLNTFSLKYCIKTGNSSNLTTQVYIADVYCRCTDNQMLNLFTVVSEATTQIKYWLGFITDTNLSVTGQYRPTALLIGLYCSALQLVYLV